MYDLIKIPTNNYSSRKGLAPLGLVVHAMGLPLEDALMLLTQGNVSCHYLVPQINAAQFIQSFPQFDQELMFPQHAPVISIVDENYSAWHCGPSRWKKWNQFPGCETGLNLCTIGVEFHTPGYAIGDNLFHFTPYTELQMLTGAALLKDIAARHSIGPENLLAHSDISCWRGADQTPCAKTDPGPLFPWLWLHHNHKLGISPLPSDALYWPKDLLYTEALIDIHSPAPDRATIDALETIGYMADWDDSTAAAYTINAYRMRYMGRHWKGFNGKSDRELMTHLFAHSKII